MQSLKTKRSFKSLSVVAVVAMLSAGGAQAQTLRNADEPAEFPPLSFKGSQYVDSRGCVYVRTGTSVSTNWVPRVARNRSVLCGFKPSLEAAERALPVIPDPVEAEVQTAAVAPAAQNKPAFGLKKQVRFLRID